MRPPNRFLLWIKNVKTESSKWISLTPMAIGSKESFAWKDGYGAFSYSKSHVPNVIRYVQNQEIHHRKETFLNEYSIPMAIGS